MDELTKKRSIGWAVFSLHSDIGQSIAECDPTHIWMNVRVRQVLGRWQKGRSWGQNRFNCQSVTRARLVTAQRPLMEVKADVP